MENVYVINGANIFSKCNNSSKQIQHYTIIRATKKNDYAYIIMNSEQIGSAFFKDKFYIQLMKNNFVFDHNHLSSKYLEGTFQVRVLSYFSLIL